MWKFDDSHETGNWLHTEAFAEAAQGTLKSIQHDAAEIEERPTRDNHEDTAEPRLSLGD